MMNEGKKPRAADCAQAPVRALSMMQVLILLVLLLDSCLPAMLLDLITSLANEGCPVSYYTNAAIRSLPVHIPRAVEAVLALVLCHRLKHGNAFQAKNNRLMKWIGICFALNAVLFAAMSILDGRLNLGGAYAAYNMAGGGLQVFVHLGVALVCFALHHLMLRASSIQQVNDETV